VAVIDVPLRGGIDDRVIAPADLAGLPTTERLGIGDLTLDLADVDFTGDERHLTASVAIGQLTVVVPDGVTVELHGDVGVGVVDAFELQNDGWTPSVDETFEGSGPGRIELDLEVGIGHVEVRRG
jgi:predicted membrane protein